MRRFLTAESSSTKFCTSTPWADVMNDIFESPFKMVQGFWKGGGAKFGTIDFGIDF